MVSYVYKEIYNCEVCTINLCAETADETTLVSVCYTALCLQNPVPSELLWWAQTDP